MLKSNSFQGIRMVNVLHKNIFHKDTRSFFLDMQELKYHKKIPSICLLEGLKESCMHFFQFPDATFTSDEFLCLAQDRK